MFKGMAVWDSAVAAVRPALSRPSRSPRARSICRVDLTTGDSRAGTRAEADDSVVSACRDIIVRISGGSIAEPVHVLGVSGYSISGRATSKCMFVTVWADGPPPEQVVSIAVARDERRGRALWCTLHRISQGSIVTNPDRQPGVPWCATLIEPGLTHHIDAWRWLGAFELGLAWAWLERFSIARAASRKLTLRHNAPSPTSPMQ